MTPRKRTRNNRRRHYRSDVSRNDQGIQEEEAISTTPDSEPVDVGEGGANQNDRNEAEKPRKGLDNLEARRAAARARARRNRRRRLADQSDDFDLDTSSDIQREVKDEDVEVSESAPETQPKDAKRARRRRAEFQPTEEDFEFWFDIQYPGSRLSDLTKDQLEQIYQEYVDADGHADKANQYGASKKRAPSSRRRKTRRRTAGFLDKLTEDQRKMVMDNHNSWYDGEFDPNEDPSVTEERAFDLAWETGIVDDDGNFNQDAWDHGHDADPRARGASRRRRSQARRRKAVDLGVAEPDGRVDVERPVENTTDDEAQASQFNKKDFGSNAGDDVADPDLTTDQNWVPGEGKKESRFNKRASQIEGMRLAEAMIEAGVEDPEDRWKLAERYTKLSSIVVRDRISLLEKVANVKSTAPKEKVQRTVRASNKSQETALRGLGQSPSLNKSASHGQTDDYSLYF